LPPKRARHGAVAFTLDDWKKKCKQLESKLLRLNQKASGESPVKGQREGASDGEGGGGGYELEGKELHWNLKRHVQGLLDERTTIGAGAWSQLVVAVLQSKEVKRSEEYKAMELEGQARVVDEIQKPEEPDGRCGAGDHGVL
jgi:hypothetical protein